MGLLRRNHTDDEHVVKGPSLARGPAHLIGTALLVFGLLALIKHNDFPSFGDAFPDATATGGTFLGIGVNGWTAWLCIAAGGLLLFGAAQHLAARTMALVVGLALGAASVIALRDGDDVLGLAYANGWTKLGLGAAAAALLLIALLPRTRKTVHDDQNHVERTDHVERERHVAPVPAAHTTTEHTEVHAPQRTGRFDRNPEPVRDELRDVHPVHAGHHHTEAADRVEHVQRAEPVRATEHRTEAIRPERHRETTGTTGYDPTTQQPMTGTRRDGGLVGRLRRMTDDR